MSVETHKTNKEELSNEEKYVQAYISNISFAKSIDEIISRYDCYEEITTLDPFFNEENIVWTAPKWVKNDDIVFFMFSKTSIDTIRHLKKEFKTEKDSFSNDVQTIINNSLNSGENLYEQYGGCIFAIGKVNGKLINDDFAEENGFHWKGRIYAPISDIILLEKPLHISEFNSFILVSRQSSITPIFGDTFEKLKDLILSNNEVTYLQNSHSCPVPLAKISSDNWFDVANEYRRSFFLEYQFRAFFVNYFLPFISDDKRFYEECPCIKKNQPRTFVDNVILFKSKYLPVEIKLNIDTEKDLKSQCKQYCSLEELFLSMKNKKPVNQDKVYSHNVLIIDTNSIFLFSEKENSINHICDFDDFSTINGIQKIRNLISSALI